MAPDAQTIRPSPGVDRERDGVAARAPLTIFLVNFDFPPIGGPGMWRALGFAKYLALEGHTVHIFCSDRPSWHQRFDPSLLAQLPASGVVIHRIHSVLLGDIVDATGRVWERWRRPALRRLGSAVQWHLVRLFPAPEIHWLVKVTGSLVAQSRRIRPDCVLTSGPPHICHLAGLALRRLKQVPWIVDFRDLWLDDPSQRAEGPYQERLVRRLQALVLGRADAVVTVSPSWQRHLGEKVRSAKGPLPVHLIRNGHDLRPSDALRVPPHSAGGPLHIHFGGAPQGNNLSNTLVDALARLRRALGGDARLPIVTFTGFERPLREQIARQGLEANVRNVGALSWSASLEANLAADVLLVIVNNEGAMKSGTIPAKLYEAMALGRHVLALVPQGSDVIPILAEYGDATVCDVDDVEAVGRALHALIDRHERGELVHAGEKVLPDPRAMRYSRQAQAGELGALVESLAARRRARGR
jgi:glycosyltransferase involved in cell wall biosynthesis